jgi:hypothetical protein
VALAVKFEEVWPPFTVALEGTVRFALLLESGITNPPAGAGEVKEIVHCVFPGVFRVVDEHTSPLNAGVGETETVPEAPAAGIESPAAVAATTPVI